MDKSLTNEVVAESSKVLKCWSAPKLTEADIADMTEFGFNPGVDGTTSTSTLS